MESVLVLLSSYNGEEYIREQLQSLINQENLDVSILLRDDGSSDHTLEIVEEYKEEIDITIIKGTNIGYANSFMTLVHLAREYKADYYAFCDQDDVWENDKLQIAISKLKKYQSSPALYLSQAKIVDVNLAPIASTFHKRKVELGSVLEHNYAIGCTMVFNEKLRKILDINIENMCLTCGHDSWVYLVALSVNSNIYFDLEGHVLYRQHGTNASGKILTIKQAVKAVRKILVKWKNARSNTAKKILKSYENMINEENMKILVCAAYYRRSLRTRIRLLINNKLNSDYFFADFLFKVAVVFGLF